MNSFDRVSAAISFRQTDRVPVIPQIFAHTAVLSGYHIIDYVQNGALAAECQLKALHYYEHDVVFNVLDLCIEPEALGAQIQIHRDLYPTVARPVLNINTSLEDIIIPDIESAGRIPEVLTAARHLRAAVEDTVPVVGLVQGPMTVLLQILGASEALYLAIDNPERFEKFLNFTTEFSLRYGLAQLHAGSHLIMIFEPGGSPEVVPSGFFREFIAPRLKALFKTFKQAGSATNWLHIAGKTSSILDQYPGIGVDIANFDYCVSHTVARTLLPSTCLDGNIKPISFLSESSESIIDEAQNLIDYFSQTHGFILSSGCEIPPESPKEKIFAFTHIQHTQ